MNTMCPDEEEYPAALYSFSQRRNHGLWMYDSYDKSYGAIDGIDLQICEQNMCGQSVPMYEILPPVFCAADSSIIPMLIAAGETNADLAGPTRLARPW